MGKYKIFYSDNPSWVVLFVLGVMIVIDVNKLIKLQRLIDTDKADAFYSWAAWHKVRADVLKLDHNECQMCKAKGRYRRGSIVHHVHHLKDRPDLALSIYDDEGRRQLITVCKSCHEELHPESQQQHAAPMPLTEERWD